MSLLPAGFGGAVAQALQAALCVGNADLEFAGVSADFNDAAAYGVCHFLWCLMVVVTISVKVLFGEAMGYRSYRFEFLRQMARMEVS